MNNSQPESPESECPQDEPQPENSQAKTVELLLELSKKASERFDKRQSIGWKLSFGLWLGLASGAGLVWKAEASISPWPWAVLLLAGIAGILYAVVYFYYELFIEWMGESNRRDIKTSYYWETAATDVLRYPLPPGLAPNKSLAYEEWPEYPKDKDMAGKPTNTEDTFLTKLLPTHDALGDADSNAVLLKSLLQSLAKYLPTRRAPVHRADAAHLYITILLAILFFLSFCVRAFSSSP